MTKRTPQLETAILEGFAAGQTIASLCREHGISRSTVQNWKRDPDFTRRYEDAQPEHAEALIDEAMRIAEDPTSDWVARRAAQAGEGDATLDHLRHARLRIDTRLRIARIHLKRHEAALDRRAREAEREGDARIPDYVTILEAACARFDRGEAPYRSVEPFPRKSASSP